MTAGEIFCSEKLQNFFLTILVQSVRIKKRVGARPHEETFLRKGGKSYPHLTRLVRKGREQVTYKSTSPAMQKGLNTLKNRETDQCFSPEARRLHRCAYLDS